MKSAVTVSASSNTSQRGAYSQNLYLGIWAALTSIVLFSTMDATVKWVGATYPLAQLLFFRCAVAFIPVFIILHRAGGIRILKTGQPLLHGFRSLFGVLAMASAFHGFTVMPLADASAIFYTAPLLAVALSVPMLGAHVGVRRWTAITIGLVGVLIIIRPGGNVLSQGGLFMLAAAVFVAVTTNIVRKLNATDPAITITFYFTLTGTVVASIACLFFGWVTPTPTDLILLICIGLLGGCAQYALTTSYRYGEVSIIAPFKYLSIITGGIFGYVVWSEIPDGTTLIGITIILCCGFYSMHRESKLARESDIRDKIPSFPEK